jgi:hypothetical protein
MLAAFGGAVCIQTWGPEVGLLAALVLVPLAAAACASLLEDADAYTAASKRVRALTPSLRWSEVARPLVEFCLDHRSRPRRRPPRWAVARATYGQYPDILADARSRGGVPKMVARASRHVARVLRHRA